MCVCGSRDVGGGGTPRGVRFWDVLREPPPPKPVLEAGIVWLSRPVLRNPEPPPGGLFGALAKPNRPTDRPTHPPTSEKILLRKG